MLIEKQVVNQARLSFKRLQMSDTAALTSALIQSSHELQNFIPWGWEIPYWDENGFRTHVSNYIKSEKDDAYIFYFRDVCIGFGDIVGDSNFSQVAIWVRSEYQGTGIGEFILSTLEKIAFEQKRLKVLHYIHDVRNARSANLAKKCGYRFNAVIPNQSLNGDREVDLVKTSERYFMQQIQG